MSKIKVFFRMILLMGFIGSTYFILPQLKIDNSLVRWLPEESESIQNYQSFLEEFNSDALLILAIENDPEIINRNEINEKIVHIKNLEYVINIAPWPTKNVQYKKHDESNLFTYIIRFISKSHLNPNRPELIDEIEELFKESDTKVHLAGTGVIHKAINEQTQYAMNNYLMAGIVLLFIVLILILRSPIAILQTILVALGSVSSILYCSILFGIPISLVHTIIPVIILFYSTSISLHILFHSGDFEKVFKPSLLVVVTTSIGFSVFLSDNTPLLRDFAILGMTGLLSSFVWSIIIFYPKTYQFAVTAKITGAFENVPVINRRIIVPVFLGFFIIFLPGIFKLRAEIHSLSVLSPSSKAYQDHIFIESKIGYYFPIEYIVNEEKIERGKISKWVNTVYNMDRVGAVIPYYRISNFTNKRLAGYQSKLNSERYRVTFMIPLLSTTEGLQLAHKINDISKATLGTYQPELTGFITLYANVVKGLFSSFWKSLVMAFILIFLLITFYIRNFKLVIFAVVANVFPIIAMLGLMGWLGINLDMVTIPIGCLLFSIVVDDTIHFMYWYKTSNSTAHALSQAGPGIFFTSVILVLGFSVLLFAEAPPMQYFAILSLFAIVTALLSDLIVLPSLLIKSTK